MSGIKSWNVSGPSGMPRSYKAIAPAADYEAPDNCIGFYAKSAGDVTFNTIEDRTNLTFPLTAGQLLPAEVHNVSAWTGTAGDLYAAVR